MQQAAAKKAKSIPGPSKRKRDPDFEMVTYLERKEVKQKLRMIAAKRAVSVGEIVRIAVANFLSNNN